MKKTFGIIITILFVCSLTLQTTFVQKASAHNATYKFVNGLWFNGQTFEPKTVYSVNGVFQMKHDGEVTATIDLENAYAIPPFAEAHNHHFMNGFLYEQQIKDYLAKGIFYAKNPNSLPYLTEPISEKVNIASSVDVSYSNGGITATDGHPVQIFDSMAERGMIKGLTKKDMEGQAYYIVNNEAELTRQWTRIKASKPDFIKAYLERSEEYEKRKDDPKFYGKKALNPALLPKIVKLAHKDNLRVSVHVTSSADFHTSVMAGVDEITHLPLALITEEDAIATAKRGIVVVTTTTSHRPTDGVSNIHEIHRANLLLLHKHGVKLALGTDNFEITVLEEALNLYKLNVFDNLTLLKMWTDMTAKTIFPKRKIGEIKDGYEASFITLEENPLKDFSAVKKVKFRFKQGHDLNAEVSK